MKLKKSVLALALSLGFVANASALDSTFNVGTISAPTYFSDVIQKGIGAFNDTWNFTIATPTYSGGSVSNLAITIPDLGNLFNIADLSVQLFTSTNLLISNLDSNEGSTSQIKVGSGTFLPGSYYFNISGNANGLSGGQYVFAVTTLPVPEPETYAMLLAGLGLVTVMARRRLNKQA
ncbi:MAG: FxDxF family PEP-CTERM protein [Azoarcus sp.]|nr:FxDxF family PEP-CTERM protein [Azoarcus sp.]